MSSKHSQSLFSEDGRRALRRLNRGSLLAFDFDGTLVPILERGQEAFLPPEIVGLLRQLVSLTPVAILSGRSERDLRPRLGFQPRFIFGNHGLEGPAFHRQGELAERLVKVWRRQLPTGPHIEDKVYSITLHYREAANRRQTRERLLRQVAQLDPRPRIIGGKCTLNLLPANGIDKGAAIKFLMKQTRGAALFVGDDDTDEQALKIKDPRLITVRVGQIRHSEAAFYVRRQSGIGHLLELLLDQFSRP